jgi:retron-type reverse transcriptase
MKRAGNLFERIVERDNLRLAVHKALRGKRDRPEAIEFRGTLDRRLADMAEHLRAGTYPVGVFRQFVIHDPKERIITAPCFAERVVHHAIMNVCEPVFDRWLIADTFACRTGKGRMAALLRARQFARRQTFFLRLDVRKYFDSIPHDELLARLERRFKDGRLLALFARIVRSFRGELGHGVPIGSLTSQHLANFYLGWFDRFVKETLRIKAYVRYMDDMVLWCETTAEVKDALDAGRTFLRGELRLEFKASPYWNRTHHGMDFLGCRVFNGRLTLNARSRRRFGRQLAELERQHEAGAIDEGQLQRRATALVAFTRAPGLSSRRFRASVLNRMRVNGHQAPTG